MASDIFEKFYDPDDRENSWIDTEPKSVRSTQRTLTDGMKTKDELEAIESSLKTWHDGDVRPELLDPLKLPE